MTKIHVEEPETVTVKIETETGPWIDVVFTKDEFATISRQAAAMDMTPAQFVVWAAKNAQRIAPHA